MPPGQRDALRELVGLCPGADDSAWTSQVAAQLGISTQVAYGRLRRLTASGHVSHDLSWLPQTSVRAVYWAPTAKGRLAVR